MPIWELRKKGPKPSFGAAIEPVLMDQRRFRAKTFEKTRTMVCFAPARYTTVAESRAKRGSTYNAIEAAQGKKNRL